MYSSNTNRMAAQANFTKLCSNSYPGRGLVIGLNDNFTNLIMLYFLTGRSESSRNRKFVVDDLGNVSTQVADLSHLKKDADLSLIIYRAMAERDNCFVVSNGDQTDTVMEGLVLPQHVGVDLELLLETRQYEPDSPNFTPRITGLCVLDSDDGPLFQIVVLKKDSASDACVRSSYCYEIFQPGFGMGVTTYTGDGNPLPSWEGNPVILPLSGSVDEIANEYWTKLSQENLISLVVKSVPIDGGQTVVKVLNKY